MRRSLSSLASWSPISAWRCNVSSRCRIEFLGSGADRVSHDSDDLELRTTTSAADDDDEASSEVTSKSTRVAGTRMSASCKN